MLGEDFLKRLFSLKTASPQGLEGKESVGDRTDTAVTAKMEMEAFAQRVKSLFSANGEFVTGSVQMLVLTQLKEHFGSQWPHVSGKIHALIQSILNNRLNPSDCYTVFGESTYVIVFASLSTKAASMKVALMAEEVARKLFGDAPPKDLFEIGIARLSSDTDFSVETLSSADLIAKMSALASKTAEVTDVKVPSSRSDRVDQAGSHEQDRSGETQSPKGDNNDWRDMSPSQQDVNEWIPVRTIKPDSQSLDEWAPINDSREAPPDLMFVYRPAWLIKNDMIAAHTCVPARVSPHGIAITGGRAMPARRATLDNVSLDVVSLRKVMDDFEQLGRQGRQAFVILPVHVQTLEVSKYRNPYKEILEATSPEQRDHIVFELICVDETIPQLNVAHAISTLRPFCRDLMVRTRLETPHFSDFHTLGVHAVGIDLSGSTLSERDTYAHLNAYCAKAREARLCTFAHGISSRSLTSGAAAAGFRYIDGSAIATAVEMPAPNRSWTARDVYSALIEELEKGN